MGLQFSFRLVKSWAPARPNVRLLGLITYVWYKYHKYKHVWTTYANLSRSRRCTLMEHSHMSHIWKPQATSLSLSVCLGLFYTHRNYTCNHNAADNLNYHFGDVGVFRGEYLILWGHGWVCRSPSLPVKKLHTWLWEEGSGRVLRISRRTTV